MEKQHCIMEEVDREEDFNYGLWLGPHGTNPSVLVNSKRLAEFLTEKIREEYANWQSKTEKYRQTQLGGK